MTNVGVMNGNGFNPAVKVHTVALRAPQATRNGIVLYGQVLSGDGITWYTVKKERMGRYQFAYRCTCAGNFLGKYSICRHLAVFKLAETNRL